MSRIAFLFVTLLVPMAASAQMQVVSTSPTLNAISPPTSTVSVTFDRALNTATVTTATFRVSGQWSGAGRGAFTFSNGNKTVTVTPTKPFSAGEMVFVNLSHALLGADATPLRSAGYAFQFRTAVVSGGGSFNQLTSFSNRIAGAQTRIYGASAADLDNDGYLDLTTVNEVSADVRVFLNRGDGSGLYQPMLAPQDIGVEASPHAPGDFNNDGNLDLCVSATTSQSVWILLGAGDGTFSSITEIPAGGDPHGIQALDVDGDGDLDIVNASAVGGGNLALFINNGAGVFSAPTFFEGGVNGEYGLAAADMDGDGITDLVVGGRDGSEIIVMRGNGNGTFTAAGTPKPSGGSTWVVVVGDVDGDGDLDVAAANDGSGTVGVLRNQGDGTLTAATTINIGAHTPSVRLGDLDGDTDLDMVVSSYGGGFWSWYRNDGTGNFSFVEQFAAPSNPSCAVIYDSDNDGDLDLGFFDEIADVVVLMRNGSVAPPTSDCSSVPSPCRQSTQAGKSKLLIKDKSPNSGDTLLWKLTKGDATSLADFGDPTSTADYALCVYEDGVLKHGYDIPAGASWKATSSGYSYHSTDRLPAGILAGKLKAGADGATTIKVKGKGDLLALSPPGDFAGVLKVQLQRTDGSVCWGATFSPPFSKQDSVMLKAASDAPPTTAPPEPIWSAIHAQVIGSTCGGCHGGSGGLSGMANCNTAYASLVGVSSTENPPMPRVDPGNPGNSWMMIKLDGAQGWFSGTCGGGFCGSQMPLGGELSVDVRDAIRFWIANGAANDCP